MNSDGWILGLVFVPSALALTAALIIVLALAPLIKHL
jgi:hypothetical protein